MLDLLIVGFKAICNHRFVVYIRQSCVYERYEKAHLGLQAGDFATPTLRYRDTAWLLLQ